MSQKRQRERPAADTQLIEIYEDLANLDGAIRVKAAHTLLTVFVVGHEAGEEAIQAILRRLLRGLCSGRKAARLGFSVALTEVLIELFGGTELEVPTLQDISSLIQTLKQQTSLTGGNSGQEERDCYLGRLFGAEAITRSGILFRNHRFIASWASIVDTVLEIAARKALLREECGYMLYSILEGSQLPCHAAEFAEIVVERLCSHGLAKTPEGVAIWIVVQRKYPKAALPGKIWHNSDPLDRKEKASLTRILREGTLTDTLPLEDPSVAQIGHWSASLPFAWHAIVSQILPFPGKKQLASKKHSGRLRFDEFWAECIDNVLFAASSSQERKYWGFLLVQRLLSEATSQTMPTILSPNFMSCFVNQLSSPDRFLHRTADKTRKAIIERAQSLPDTAAAILCAMLTAPHGEINFEFRTKTRTIDNVLCAAAAMNAGDVLRAYDQLLLRPNTNDEKLAASNRRLLADHLVTALRGIPSGSVMNKNYDDFIQGVLSMLAKYAYHELDNLPSDDNDNPEPVISSASRSMFRERISSCFSVLMKDAARSSTFALTIVRSLRSSDSSSNSLLLKADSRIRGLLNKGFNTLSYLENSRKDATPANQSLQQTALTLVCMAILEIHNGDADAVEMLEELHQIFNGGHVGQHQILEKRASAALVDITLALISKPSLLFRRLSLQIFASFTADIDENGLGAMLKVLHTKENLAGQTEMFKRADSDNDSVASGSSNIQESDQIDGTDAASTDSLSISDPDAELDDKSEDEATTETTEDSEAKGTDGELAIFNAKLLQALGTQAGLKVSDAEESSTSSEEMDDEQMEKLDVHLETIFHERGKLTNKKNEQRDAKEAIVNFKRRVLELLEVYIKHEHAKNLSLKVVFPLLALIRTSNSPVVSRKACDLIREYTRLCRGDGLPVLREPETALDALRSVHEEAGINASKAHGIACSQASLLLVRMLVALDKEHLRRIVAVYAQTQERFLFDPMFKVKPSLFMEWLNWCQSAKR